MNLKISEKGFRFRITPEDLEHLLHGRDVEQSVCLGKHCFSYRITQAGCGEEMSLEMAIGGFCLCVPREVLETLQTMGRSRDGIMIRQAGVEVALQVDLKMQMRKAA